MMNDLHKDSTKPTQISPNAASNILVVDDTPANLKLLVSILLAQGYKVRAASNGNIALTFVQTNPVDLILLDIKMPSPNGFEVCEILKSDPNTHDIPIIFISALHDVSEKVKGFSLGGVDYITKPFQSEEVIARVQTHISMQKIKQDLEQKNIQLEREITSRKQYEKVIVQGQKFLQNIFDAIQDGISVLDNHLVIKRVNTQMEKWYAYKGQIIGQKCYEVYQGRSESCKTCPSLRALNTGMPQMDELPLLDAGGQTVGWLEVHSFPIHDTQGTTTGIVEYIRDITSKKLADENLKKSQHFIQRITESNPNIIYVYDLVEKKAVYVNMRVVDFLGYTPSEVAQMGRQFVRQILHPDDFERRKQYMEKLNRIADDEILTSDYRIQSKNGEWRWFHMNDTVFQRKTDGTVQLIIGTAQDITDRKRLEEELIHAKNAAEAASKAKSEFLSRMSHEIRTPMNSIIGLSHLLMKLEMTEKQRDYLNKIQSSAHMLLQAINDIFDFSEINSAMMTIQGVHFNMHHVLDEILHLMASKSESKGIHIRSAINDSLSELLIGDPMRLEQVISKLLDNAIKFTESGEITLTAQLVEKTRQDAQLMVRIQDTGIGIQQDKLEEIFEPFHQADTTLTRKYGGIGLGLTLCRRLAEMMGGEIRVESKPGLGSTFIFTAKVGLVSKDERTSFAEKTVGSDIPSRNYKIFKPIKNEPDCVHKNDAPIDHSLRILSQTEIQSRLERLSGLLEEHDMESLEVVEELIEQKNHSGPASQLRLLKQYVSQYDFEKALEILHTILSFPVDESDECRNE